MTKAQLTEYLTKQINLTDNHGYDLQALTNSICSVLNSNLGTFSDLGSQLKNVDYSYTMSYEELYPKQVIDYKATSEKVKTMISSIIEQINIIDESQFSAAKAASNSNDETLKLLTHSLKDRLTGKQIQEIKTLATQAASKERDASLLELIKTYDVEVIQEILSDTLLSKSIWKSL